MGQYNVVLSEIKEKPSTSVGENYGNNFDASEPFRLGLRAIKLLATYMNDASSKEIAMLQMREWLSDPVASGNKTVQIIAANLFICEDNLKEAFKVIKNGSNMEQ